MCPESLTGELPAPKSPSGSGTRFPALRILHILRILRLGRIRNAYMIRGLALWIGLRLAASILGQVHLTPLASLFLLAVIALATYLDARRRGEDIFLGNLGIPGTGILLAALPFPLLLELVIR